MFQSLSGFQVRCNSQEVPQLARQLTKFQSLSGFQVRCNWDKWSGSSAGSAVVSIPIGFSSSLQPILLQGQTTQNTQVSIPIGFSSSLQHAVASMMSLGKPTFQSLSGFQVRCNQVNGLYQLVGKGRFNPYRVFKFVATIMNSYFRGSINCVSIPIGFSSSLQPGRSGVEPPFLL